MSRTNLSAVNWPLRAPILKLNGCQNWCPLVLWVNSSENYSNNIMDHKGLKMQQCVKNKLNEQLFKNLSNIIVMYPSCNSLILCIFSYFRLSSRQMQALRRGVYNLTINGSVSINNGWKSSGIIVSTDSLPSIPKLNLHTCNQLYRNSLFPEPKKWPKYNEKVFPPQQPEEEKRPAVR